jgi:stage II sporulation protein E
VGVLAGQEPSKIQKYFWPDLPEIIREFSVSSPNVSGWRLKLKNRIVKYGVQFILIFLVSRAILWGEIFPGAVPLVLAQRRCGYWERILSGAAVFLGTGSVSGWENAVWFFLPLFFLDIFCVLCQLRRWSWTDWSSPHFGRDKQVKIANRQGLIEFGAWTALRLFTGLIRAATLTRFYSIGIELGIGFGLLILFQSGFNFLANPAQKSKWSTFGLALIAGICLSGATGIRIYSVQVAEAALVLLLMTVAYLGGGGAGVVMGILITMLSGLTNGEFITKVALFGVLAVLAAALKNFGKWGTITGACCSFYLIGQQPQFGIADSAQILSWGVGLTSFALMPRRFLAGISEYVPGHLEDDAALRQRRLKEIISARLSSIANIFEEMARNFNAETNGLDPVDLYALLEQVSNQNCKHCNGYEVCWKKNFYSTYREVFDLLACAELYGEVNPAHLKGKLRQNCYQQYKLLNTVNHLFEKFQTEIFWRRKYETGKNLLTAQLQGVAHFMNDLAGEVSADYLFKEGFEASIKYSLNKLGITVKEVTVAVYGRESLEIRICQKGCHRNRECQNLIAPMLMSILGEKYMVWKKQCCLEGGYCHYLLIPAFKYEVLTTVCKLPKNGNHSSGDSHALHQLKDGHFVTILSDGMGHGSKAAEESRMTVNVLERLLENGIDRDFAVRMVNSLMSLRSPEESFATVDLTLVDRYTAKVEFIKIGAAASYIKRGREVWTIKSTSLPAGILNTVDVERTVSQLQSGDLVIMATDGVVDSKPDQNVKEDWVVRALSKVEVTGPEALGEYLLNLARINQDGEPKDDMTIVVLQVYQRDDSSGT